MNSQIKNQNEKDEQKVQNEIYKAIDKKESFIFDAGAGAGKTYALIESLKYILQKNFEKFKHNNQKILCITYTNVATNEIKKRLGNSSIVDVSTIHEMLWSYIKRYKKTELVNLYKTTLDDELKKLEKDIEKETKLTDIFLKSESESEKLISEEARKIFYDCDIKFSKATDFKDKYIQGMGVISTISLKNHLSNVSDFRAFMKKKFKIIDYKNLIDTFEEKKSLYSIEYDADSNIDRLKYQKFSHDTLLKYSLKLFEDYPILRKMITDQYPYIFIDEYQDTDIKVIEIIKLLNKEINDPKKKGMVGFFGDTYQQIYSDNSIGGQLIEENENNYKVISKKFNRRSHQQIVDVINKIRQQKDFRQEVLDPNKNKGSIAFKTKDKFLDKDNENNEKSYIIKAISEFRKDYKLKDNESVDCLVPLNKTIAELGNFQDIYDKITKTKLINYNEFGTKFLSHDLKKLHPAIRFIYKLIKIYFFIDPASTNKKFSMADLYGHTDNLTIYNAYSFYKKLRTLKDKDISKLDGFITSLSSIVDPEKDNNKLSVERFLKHNFTEFKSKKDISKESFATIFKQILQELSKDNENLNLLYKSPLEQWINWINFIDESTSNINYHTIHSTKGIEYENVIIFIGADFGSKNKNKFKDYFSNICQEIKDESNKFQEARNLIYVACSRAIKRLWFVYTDELDDNVKKGLEHLFSKKIN